MSDLNVCLICLCKGVKMYDYNEYKLKLYYEEDIALKMIDGLPKCFCYLCAATLYKFHKFKEKCHIGQQTLKELLSCGPITSASISQVDRKGKHLQTPIGVITLTNRVKTYTLDIDNVANVFPHSPKREKYKNILFESDNSVEYTNISDCKIEIVEESLNSDVEKSNVDEQRVNVDKQKDRQRKNGERGKVNVAIQNLYEEWDRAFSDSDENKPANNADKSNLRFQDSSLHKRDLVRSVITRQRKRRMESEEKVVTKRANIINKEINKDNVMKEKIKRLVKKVNTARNNDTKAKRKNKVEKADTTKNKNKPVKEKPQLDPEYWLKISMTEQEAMDNFIARSQEPKYKAAAYKCDQCYVTFSKEDILTRHTKLLHDQSRGPYECHFCYRRFNKKNSLTKHNPVHYHKFKCLRCNIVFLHEASAVNHNDLHNGFVKKCEPCSLEFRHLTTYYSHIRIFHRSEHVCTLCGVSFVSQKGLQQHKSIKHINADVNPDEAGQNTYCEKCDIQFGTRQAFYEHFGHSAKHADVVPPEEPEDQDEEDMSANDISANTSLKCKIITPETQRNIKNRVTTTCFVCKKVFLSYYRYKKHHRAVHKNIPIPEIYTQMCEVCGIIIKGTIAAHMNTHTRENMHPCPTCGMKFTLKSNMTRHIETQHTVREKPAPIHKCPLCDKRYTEKGNMTVHYRTVHLQQPHPRRNRRRTPKEEPKNDED